MGIFDNLMSGRGLLGISGAADDAKAARLLENQQKLMELQRGMSEQGFQRQMGAVPFSPYDQQTPRGKAETLSFLDQGGPVAQTTGLALQAPGLPLTAPQQQDMALTASRLETERLKRRDYAQKYLAAGVSATNSAIDTLGDDYRTQIKPITEIVTATDQLKGLLSTGTALGGVAAVVKLAKALDPTTGVRGNETGNLTGATGITQILQDTWNKLGGENMSPESIRQFTAVADELVAVEAMRGLELSRAFTSELSSRGVGENRINNVMTTSGIKLSKLMQLAAPAIIRNLSDEELALYEQLYEKTREYDQSIQ